MAIGTIADVQSFEAQYRVGMLEMLAKNLGFINQTQGAITVSTEFLGGNFARSGVRRQIPNLIRRRDATDVADLTPLAAPETADIGVKIKGGTFPIEMTRDSWHEITGSSGGVEQAGLDYGRDAGNQMVSAMIDDVMAGLSGCLTGETANVITSTGATLTTDNVVDLCALYGDAARSLSVLAMHSKPYHNLVKNQIGLNVDGISNFNIQTANPVTLSRAVAFVDSSTLITAGAPNVYRTFALRPGAVKVTITRPLDVLIDDVGGKGNLIKLVQAEWDYVIEIPGSAWNTAVVNPSVVALGTDANWTKTATSFKHLPGVMITTN